MQPKNWLPNSARLFYAQALACQPWEKGDHSGYIAHWLKVLKEDNRIVTTAANEASKAVDYLRTLNCNKVK